jgi:uncharacterized protein YqjF (DUF2071 family)
MTNYMAQLASWRPWFRADWTQFVFVHYSLPPEDLAPYTPFELDCRDGRAFLSLVFFRMEGMRPARFVPATIGRMLFRPASNHWFLNVRTYVRGAGGRGIQFLVEWMDNPLGLRLGPWLYGLPYRSGKFNCQTEPENGRTHLRVTDSATGEALQVSIRRDTDEEAAVCPASLDGFLLEKYTAYTHHRGISRLFKIFHPRWKISHPTVLEIDDTLVRNGCPWFEHAEMISAHASVGFRNVAMGPPHRLPAKVLAGNFHPVAQPAVSHLK